MKRYQYILLDWDGCLARTMDVLLNAIKLELFREGVLLEDQVIIKKIFGNWIYGLKYFGAKKPEESFFRVMQILAERLPKVQLYPGVEEVLKELNEREKKLALITSSRREAVMPAMQELDILGYFYRIVTRDEIDERKPDPMVIERILKAMKGGKKAALIVGNSVNDVQMGKEAGITTVVFFPKENEKYYQREEFERKKPDYIIRDFRQLLQIVK